MRSNKYRYLIPNGVTFLSLTCGIISILVATNGRLILGGLLILASYILDLFDGELARRLEASSAFGQQLDSLVDMVSLGVAPAILTFFHLQDASETNMVLTWPVTVFYVLAGAFRLARFNLLPMKEGQTESIGLTISTAGATLTLAVLSDVGNAGEMVPDISFIPLMGLLGLLMISRVRFPSIVWVFTYRWASLLYLLYFAVALFMLRLSLFNTWFLFNGGYVGIGLLRAATQWSGRA